MRTYTSRSYKSCMVHILCLSGLRGIMSVVVFFARVNTKALARARVMGLRLTSHHSSGGVIAERSEAARSEATSPSRRGSGPRGPEIFLLFGAENCYFLADFECSAFLGPFHSDPLLSHAAVEVSAGARAKSRDVSACHPCHSSRTHA